MSSTHQILCGNCETPVQAPTDSDDENDILKCGNCGQSDRRSDVVESAKGYATDAAARHMQQSAKDGVRDSKFMTFKPTHIPNRTYRWIVADLGF